MMEELLRWLQQAEGPAAYAVLAGASLSEMLLPFLPGDSIAVAGVVMAVSAGYHAGLVYAALVGGGLLGGMIAFGTGRWIGRDPERRTPRFLRGPRAHEALRRALVQMERHGVLFLTIHRFIPAVRAFVFVGAGMSGVPAWKAASFGTLSLMLWNGLLLGLGWGLGASYEALSSWLSTYSAIALIVVVALLAVALVRFLRRPAPPDDPEA